MTQHTHHDTSSTRRQWLQYTTATAAFAGLAPNSLLGQPTKTQPADSSRTLRFGMITDVHQDIMHDGVERITAFASAMQNEELDFVIQLGDFCIPKPENKPFLEAYRQAHTNTHHVLGNHDMDGGYRREQTVEFYGIPSRYYAFQSQGVRCLVLDGNDPGGKQGGYPRFIAPDQLDWLSNQLQQSNQPTIVFSHQPLNHDSGVENHADVRRVLTDAQADPEQATILGCFSGHFHLNHLQKLDGLHYAQINSASYLWVGSNYEHQSYQEDIHKSHPAIRYTCPYQDPIWAIATIDLDQNHITLDGRASTWVGKTPAQLAIPAPSWSGDDVRSPKISDRSWQSLKA